MNIFAAQGIAQEAAAERRFIVVTARNDESNRALDLIIAASNEKSIARIRRSSGLQCIDYDGGGRVIVRSYRQSIRGLLADVVFVDAGVDAELNTDAWASFAAIVSTSTTGAVIRA